MAIQRSEISQVTVSFAEEVDRGLSAEQKRISSKFFYDAKGDVLFQRIMQMPEYYLTGCELEIITQRSPEILAQLSLDQPFDLIEFGAGDGTKTAEFIHALQQSGAEFAYRPIDISGDVLHTLEQRIGRRFPHLKVAPIQGEYSKGLAELHRNSLRPKVVIFLGSSIGNFKEKATRAFLRSLWQSMAVGDHLLIGFDLKKDPRIVLKAYNDAGGITRAFNINLLRRINSELGGQFEIDSFAHYPTYDPQSGYAKSYLVSTKAQKVRIDLLGKTYSFEAGESIHTEISRKYSTAQIAMLFQRAGFTPLKHFLDCRHYYSLSTAIKSKE